MLSPYEYLIPRRPLIMPDSIIESALKGVSEGHIDPVETTVFLIWRRAIHMIETAQWFMEKVGLLGRAKIYTSRFVMMTEYTITMDIFMFGNYPMFCTPGPAGYIVDGISVSGRGNSAEQIFIKREWMTREVEVATGYDRRRFSALRELGLARPDAFRASVER